MTSETYLTIFLTALGSSGLFAFIQFLIIRHDNKKGEIAKISTSLAEINKRLNKEEKDICREQMLMLMANYPEEKEEILRLAEHYFSDLHGNWYMTSLFNKWLETNGIGKPEWFDE